MLYDPRLIEFARRLRAEASPAERVLWKELRGRRFGGYRFRRQQVIEPYIADYYCSSCLLVIEVDGETHLGNEEADRRRQAVLEGLGLKVLRFWNTSVFDELESVLEAIYRECVARGKPIGAGRLVRTKPPYPRALSPAGRGEEEKTPHPQPLSPTGRGGKEQVSP